MFWAAEHRGFNVTTPTQAQIKAANFRSLLERCLRIATSGQWRDKANLSLEAHPIWDDVRAALTVHDTEQSTRDCGNTAGKPAAVSPTQEQIEALLKWWESCPLSPPCEYKCGYCKEGSGDCYCGYREWQQQKPPANTAAAEMGDRHDPEKWQAWVRADIEDTTIERCAQIAEKVGNDYSNDTRSISEIAAAIRAMKDKP